MLDFSSRITLNALAGPLIMVDGPGPCPKSDALPNIITQIIKMMEQ